MPLDKLGRYEITGKLGEGAMGVVYRAFDPLLEREVAVKTIKLDLTPAEQAEFESRFFKEARSAARLNHPAIVTVFDAGKESDMAYIAMELLDGTDLRKLITKDERLPIERVVEIVAQVADGLDYAHQNGVVHRDVKPANIMVLNTGAVRIADFGIAQLQSGARTMTGQILGTPKYMSPEQIMGKPVDGRSDIFSLGIVLYQLLTGVSPFDASSVSTIMYRVISEPAMPPTLIIRDVPRAFEVILAKALAKDPERRYQTAAEMAADLRRYRELEDAPPPDWEGSGLLNPTSVVPLGQLPSGDTTVMNRTDTIPVGLKPRAPGESSSPTLPLGERSMAGAAVDKTVPLPRPAPPSRLPVAGGVAVLAVLILAAGGFYALRGAGAPLAATVIAGQGTVSLAIAPWGEVFVDGQSAGVSPPLTELPLPAGRHKVEVRNGKLPPLSLEFDLQAGDVRKIKHKF
ncbi:MAG TPA: protein kinase [Rhodocyclaceae bacterium]|nr:protein kinase [Rhodocyclaceae bacterium]